MNQSPAARVFTTQKSRITVTCPLGISPYLGEEIAFLGYPVLSQSPTAIDTEGSLEDTMRLNLLLRTGHRVLYLLGQFIAPDAESMYQAVRRMHWEEYVSPDGYVTVTSSVENPTIRDSRYANIRCKDAIVDRLLDHYGRRPDSGHTREGAVVNLSWKGNRCSVAVDTSGIPLSKRGYRTNPSQAPMQETLAAALIAATGWSGNATFINPMCGSGTLAIEAALIGLHRPPGLLRDTFGFMYLRGFDARRWHRLKQEAAAAPDLPFRHRIIASDRSRSAVDAARRNAEAARVSHVIEFFTGDFRETPVPEGGGVVMVNPAYGHRIGSGDDLAETYRSIGDFFKKQCQGYSGYVFTGNLTLAKLIGLRTKRRLTFFNGGIECRLLEYEVYEGSRKRLPPPQKDVPG